MTTATATKTRTLKLKRRGTLNVLSILERQGETLKVESYYLRPVAGGTTFTKADGTVYTVHGLGTSCNCPARQHGAKVVCKHRAAVKRLVELGRLVAPF